jgi:hypothetical protein
MLGRGLGLPPSIIPIRQYDAVGRESVDDINVDGDTSEEQLKFHCYEAHIPIRILQRLEFGGASRALSSRRSQFRNPLPRAPHQWTGRSRDDRIRRDGTAALRAVFLESNTPAEHAGSDQYERK